MTRSELISQIAQTSADGNLGLFVGTGLSIETTDGVAKTWGALLWEVSGDIGIKREELGQLEGSSYPAIASKICRLKSEKEGIEFENALMLLKNVIIAKSAWYPKPSKAESLKKSILTLAPQWIVTTNYDSVLESTIGAAGKRVLLEREAVSVSRGTIPILHLHGHISDASSIIISEEDYVRLFRPAVYRQLKLATYLKESVTLLVGYRLSDVNVLVALDWASKALSEIKNPIQEPIRTVQILYKADNIKVDPYPAGEGLLILETGSNISLLEEIAAECIKIQEKRKERFDYVKGALKKIADESNLILWQDQRIRNNVISFLHIYHDPLEDEILAYLTKIFELIHVEAAKTNNFDAYADWLKFLVSILESYSSEEMPETLFRFVLDELDNVGYYVKPRPNVGASWKAHEDWKTLKALIPKNLLEKLSQCSCSDFRVGLLNLEFRCPDRMVSKA